MKHQRRNADHTNERKLRKGQTDAEQVLWSRLRDRRFRDLKFRRQHRVNEFILDFYCPEIGLGIELDGNPHFTELGQALDEHRTKRLEGLEIEVIRFENLDVILNTPIVLQRIGDIVDSLQQRET